MDKKYIHGSLVVDGDILEEFKSKRSELQRRLKSNQFNPDGYDLMNDRQQDVFITGIFVDPMQAEGIDNYIEFGYDNCECPDVMDELYETCPALMSKVDKFKDRKDAQTRVTIEFLDRMMDMVIQEQLTKKPRSLLEFDSPRELPSKVQAYEDRVLNSLKINGVLGDSAPQGDADANGPDAEMVIGGKTYYIEVKLNINAQMGDKTIKYIPSTGEFIASDKFDDDTKTSIETGMKQIEKDVINFINHIEDDRYAQTSKWRKQKNGDALGSFQTTFKKWKEAVKGPKKLYNKITTGFGKDIEDPDTGETIKRIKMTMPEDFIAQMYASKKLPTYYIQVGGLGFYRLGEANPANLPVPVFKGVISLESRPKPSGGEKELAPKKMLTVNSMKDGSGKDIKFLPMYKPQLDKNGKIQYKYDKDGALKLQAIASNKTKRKGQVIPWYEPVRTPRDEGKGEFFKVTGAYMGTARFRSPTGDPKDIKKSPYTLDDPKSLNAMLAAAGHFQTTDQSVGPGQSGVPDLAGFSAEVDKFEKYEADLAAARKEEAARKKAEKDAAKAAKKKK